MRSLMKSILKFFKPALKVEFKFSLVLQISN